MPMYDLPILQTNIKNFTKYIEDFINYKQLNNFTVLGNSLGGHIALVYTKQNPEKVHSMVLTGSSGLYENAFGGSFPRREDKEYLRKKIALTFYDPAGYPAWFMGYASSCQWWTCGPGGDYTNVPSQNHVWVR